MVKIVVGCDGSKGSQEALHFALDEARLRGADLLVVMAWCLEAGTYIGVGGYGPHIDPSVLEQSARTEMDGTLAALGDRAKGIHVAGVLRLGQAAQVLVEEAGDADLLIVGSRGHGGFAGLLLGSVSHQCALHASCPVVVVHSRS
jgi:nucleotide-binding universal stress UspA family protein